MSVGPDGPTHERITYQTNATRANPAPPSTDRRQDLGNLGPMASRSSALDLGGPIADPGFPLPSSTDGRQNLGTVLRYRDRVLEMGGQRPVARRDGPAIGSDLHVAAAER